VPLPKVRGIAEEEMFKVVKTGKKTAKKAWKRVVTKPTFVGPDFSMFLSWGWITGLLMMLIAFANSEKSTQV
jgi:hypothetical protein